MPGFEQTVEYSEVLAWAIIVAALVYAGCLRRVPKTGAATLALVAAFATKLALLPLIS